MPKRVRGTWLEALLRETLLTAGGAALSAVGFGFFLAGQSLELPGWAVVGVGFALILWASQRAWSKMSAERDAERAQLRRLRAGVEYGLTKAGFGCGRNFADETLTTLVGLQPRLRLRNRTEVRVIYRPLTIETWIAGSRLATGTEGKRPGVILRDEEGVVTGLCENLTLPNETIAMRFRTVVRYGSPELDEWFDLTFDTTFDSVISTEGASIIPRDEDIQYAPAPRLE
jgi:hypothetical protein